ncbi:MAG: GntR family transcriptional regulator [Pontibacterium sp.]
MASSDQIHLINTYLEGVTEAPKTAVDRIYNALHEQIVSLTLTPGMPLIRHDLCAEFNVSQTPVREALQRLERVGLIKVKPQSGTEVSYIDLKQVKRNHFLREALEFEVVRRLAQSPDPALIQKLTTLVDMQVQLANGNDEEMGLFTRLDQAFHQTMFAAVEQKELYDLVRSMAGHMDRIRRLHLPSEGKVRNIINLHRRIIECISQGDEQAAIAAMRIHLEGTLSQLDTIYHANRQYFSD